MSSLPDQALPAGMTPSCRSHPSVGSSEACTRCGDPYCAVCLFTTASGAVCPTCMMRPAAGGANGALLYALGGLGFALLGAFLLGVLVLYPTLSGAELEEPGSTVVSMAAMLVAFGGVTMAFISRDLGRGTSATLPMVGIVANLLLTAVFVLLSVVGAFM